ncbi:unnamed protein product [Leptidea sinapis]|uniref:Squalene cyclase C-terminal domain-containing protein n=1 Tax=Leptidea sinapis TaxID=189913 RepID=A0A5E4QHR5_9NEOP|nr:unnamed protein product [Leptidea sinapis]
MLKTIVYTLCTAVFVGAVFAQTETEGPTTLTTKTSTTAVVPTTVTWETETLNEGQAIQKALQYLQQHRQPDWGWGNDTHHVMLTLQQGLEMQLSAKQMEIEILLMMSKHHESPPPLARLAAYTLALGALCKDPRSFHSRDLVAALLHREPPHDLEFAYATLAACSSAAHVRRRHIRRLLDIANAAADHSLGAHQHWSLPAARKWLLERQEADGGWGDVEKTAAAVAALTPASLAAVRPPHCSDKLLDSRHEPFENGGDGNLKVSYQAGHASNDSDARNVSFTYTLNVSFYHVMQMAAEQEPKFKYEASEWPNGHYVHTLAGHKEEPMGYHYWLLYRLPEIPDPASPPGNQLVAPVEIEQQGLEMQLSAKQMEIEILLMMSKHHESPPPLARLAAYTLALGALCKDPRSFHSRDLVAALLHREPPHDLEFAYATLAACSSAAHVRRRHIRRLLDIANAAADHSLDTISMVILALRCVVQDHRHRSLIHFALEDSDSGPGAHQHWSLPAARKWLLERQEADGGWGDVEKTAAAVAALTPASLAAVRPPHCSDKLLDNRHEPFENGGDGNLKVSYQAGHASNDSDARNVSFTYTLNVSFYHVMQMAAEQEPKFKYEASEWPNGHYVHTLAGHKEEPMGYHYWLLYRLPEIPDPASPPGNQLVAPVGVDDLLVEDGEHYLFWYKKL